MRALGIDFGESRIGLAISDPEGRYAIPLETVLRRSDAAAVAAIGAICLREGVGRLVLGEPRSLVDGERGPAAERVRRFGAKLEATLGLPLELVEETLTTVAAAERLRDAGVDPRRHPERLDAMAAAIVLEEALCRRTPPDACDDPRIRGDVRDGET